MYLHGVASADDLRAVVSDKTAAVLFQHPNFFGALEDIKTHTEIAHAAGALAIGKVLTRYRSGS